MIDKIVSITKVFLIISEFRDETDDILCILLDAYKSVMGIYFTCPIVFGHLEYYQLLERVGITITSVLGYTSKTKDRPRVLMKPMDFMPR